ncbi:hypothetical protein [Grimontia marina]|uniref:Uncharacterized protein n=1 Tax=Grimontia marina TaxID=646534 RepID=A0A128EZM0_9GAMM|nr:hypothetical protein [Grimontia marina]CZF79715.1 hypothetical protein GMA8713_01099 [Grimontia marina]
MTIEITGNETLDELETMIEQYADAEVVDELPGIAEAKPDEPVTDTVDESETSDVDTTADSAPADDSASEQEGESEPPSGVATKDGQHIIPFDVLESAREENADLKEQVKTLEAKQSDWEHAQRLLAFRDRQLQQLGVELKDLPENLQLTDEQLDAMAEDYPDVGNAIRSLDAKVKRLESQNVPPSPQDAKPPEPDGTGEAPKSNPVIDAINANPDLKDWSQKGGEHWQQAILFDDELQQHPDWKDKPLHARFNEAVRLTKMHFTQQIRQNADHAEQQAKAPSLPNSPSEVGSSPQNMASKTEQLLNADVETMQALMADMPEDELESFLAQSDL